MGISADAEIDASVETPGRQQQLSRLLRRWGIPIAVLLAVRIASGIVGELNGATPLSTASWARWDSGHYADIARRGYVLEHCRAGGPYPPTAWCGNTGWFPLYPWLMRVANGVVVSLIFEALVLVLLWRCFLRERGVAALLLAAFFPGAIYQQAMFPISLVVFCALAFIACCERGLWIAAAVCGAASSMAYPTGVVLVPVAIAWMVLHRRWNAWPLVGALCGYIAVLLVYQVQTGAWNAQFLAHSHYDLGFAPFRFIRERLSPLFGHAGAGTAATAAQTLLVFVMMCLALPRSWRTLSGIYCAAYWAIPYVVGGQVSLYRAEALLVPLAVLVPRRTRIPLLIVAVPIWVAVSVQFFRFILI